MQVLLVLVPFVVAGLTVIFIAFSGGPAAAREAYLTGGRRIFRIAIPLIYVAFGAVVPAVVIASRGESEGEVGKLRTEALSDQQKEGKRLFRQTCWSCHNLDAAAPRALPAPTSMSWASTGSACSTRSRRGGTGDGRMPAGLLQGEDAAARWPDLRGSKVAGQLGRRRTGRGGAAGSRRNRRGCGVFPSDGSALLVACAVHRA